MQLQLDIYNERATESWESHWYLGGHEISINLTELVCACALDAVAIWGFAFVFLLYIIYIHILFSQSKLNECRYA